MAGRRKALVTAGLAALALAVPMAAPASAATVSAPLISGLVGPLQISVGSNGVGYVAEDFAGTLSAVTKTGAKRVIASEPGGEIAGVDYAGGGVVTFTSGTRTEDPNGGPGEAVTSWLKQVRPDGSIRTVADLKKYEDENNPDGFRSYGFQGLDDSCAAQVPPEIGGQPYSGLKDTHAYAVASVPLGYSIVADAGGNDILLVSPTGQIRTLAVLPARPVTITADMAMGLGLPDCTVGKSYNFEPVPTDVEVGRDGMLYVTSLPGGPEDGSLGALGAVFKVNPFNGRVTLVASGFAGATNLALSPGGTIYVAELFGGRISKVSNGHAVTVAEVPTPAALEYVGGKLVATIDALPGPSGPPDGKVVLINP